MQKGDTLEGVQVGNMAAEGKCVSRIDGRVLFLEGVAPGDRVDVQITRVKSNFAEGRVLALRQESPARQQPFCSHYGTCGGCRWQHLSYESQLQFKTQQVEDALDRIAAVPHPPLLPIIPSANTRYYRNRLDFSFSAEGWVVRNPDGGLPADRPPALGYHLPRRFDRVFDVEECFLQAQPSNKIRLAVRAAALQLGIPFFDLRKQVGFLRTLTIRTSSTGEVMVILQVAYDRADWIEGVLGDLQSRFPSITSLNVVINGKANDTFHDLEVKCWAGTPYITEQMSRPDGKSLKFRVGPKSFYQTNSEQAHKLYLRAWELAELTGTERVYDLYTGAGTIANFVSGSAREVLGLEYVEAAVADARINAEINGTDNTKFFAGDLKDLLNVTFLEAHGAPDVVITDPPRAGMHEAVCRMLLAAGPSKIVYVSCNPATQARDLKLLCEKYDITAVQPVDMFPHTIHVENIVQLKRRF